MADLVSTFAVNLTQGGDQAAKTLSITGSDTKVYAPEIAVGAGATVNYSIGGDPDDAKAYVITPTFNGTLTTTNNPAGTPDVIPLVANEPLAWHHKMQLAKHFANANPWTNWAFANTDAAAGTVAIMVIRDATP